MKKESFHHDWKYKILFSTLFFRNWYVSRIFVESCIPWDQKLRRAAVSKPKTVGEKGFRTKRCPRKYNCAVRFFINQLYNSLVIIYHEISAVSSSNKTQLWLDWLMICLSVLRMKLIFWSIKIFMHFHALPKFSLADIFCAETCFGQKKVVRFLVLKTALSVKTKLYCCITTQLTGGKISALEN